MKKLLSTLSVGILFALFATTASAQPANDQKGENNPQVVAYYTSGPHAIPGDPNLHYGYDLVKANGESGNFQQWFYGWSETEGWYGKHTLWKVSKDDNCKNDGVAIWDPNPAWGDYLVDNVWYCAKTNDFAVDK